MACSFLVIIYLVQSVLLRQRCGDFLSPEAFSINKDSGLITSRRRLQSYERFNLTVVATDKGQPPLWGTTLLHIEVIDINDNRPVFVRPPNGTILHIKEVNPPAGSGVTAGSGYVQDHSCLSQQNPSSIPTGRATRAWFSTWQEGLGHGGGLLKTASLRT